jgi:hypothetical protein
MLLEYVDKLYLPLIDEQTESGSLSGSVSSADPAAS